MLSKAKDLKGYKLNSLDGDIGSVQEFYFDDKYWTVRYLVANTGSWLTGKQVLISPFALVSIDRESKNIGIDLSKKQIEKSPALDTDKPISRQFEDDYYNYYAWPSYWAGPYDWESRPYNPGERERWGKFIQGDKAWDPHLRSTHAVTGYHIQAIDGEIGHVEDFIIDDDNWAIRYLVINTGNWWPGRKVLISPYWIDRISWTESKVYINHTRETIKQSPQYMDDVLPTRDFETRLHGHFNRQGYWMDELAVR